MNTPFKQANNKFLKIILATFGLISMFLGILGIFIPLLPTTPFLLLSATLFMKSSTRLYNWLLNHKYLGKHIQNYLIHRSIPIKTKITTLLFLWLTILLSVFLWVEKPIFKFLLLFIAIAVSIHILSFKSKQKK